MYRKTIIFSAFLMFSLSGCEAGKVTVFEPKNPTLTANEVRAVIEESRAKLAQATIKDARKPYVDYTIKSFSLAHGSQVEYISSDGRCYLWYQGNTNIAPCRWKMIKKTRGSGGNGNDPRKYVHICFSYSPRSRNPVTGFTGSGWQCKPALMISSRVGEKKKTYEVAQTMGSGSQLDKTKGDIFGLRKRKKVPFVMEKKFYTFEKLKQQIR